jgi:hypothetical protein
VAAKATEVFPRRDARGRAVSVVELVAAAVVGTVIGLVALLVIDGVFALIGLGNFGQASGWLAVVLPALMYFDDLRAWRGHRGRIVVAVVSAVVALGLGSVLAGLAHSLPPVVSGAVGAVVAAALYGVVWFVGVRWLSGHRNEAR